MNLTSDTQLAELFDLSVEKLHDLRVRYEWPHVRLSRFDIRFTDDQIAQIVASRTVAPTTTRAPATTGLTDRSARRSTG